MRESFHLISECEQPTMVAVCDEIIEKVSVLYDGSGYFEVGCI
jgi:hypothetical protein